MSLLKHFWLFVVLLLVVVMGVVALAIWDSAEVAAPVTPSAISEAESIGAAPAATSAPPASEQSVPDHFPAPAKKLHQLINQGDPGDAQALAAKAEQLNQRLEEINKQLSAQGIAVPEQQPPAAAADSDTEQRLNAIREHMDQLDQSTKTSSLSDPSGATP